MQVVAQRRKGGRAVPKTVSASEAKNRFGSMVDWAVQHRDEVIVQRYGEPEAVIMSFEEYQKVSQLKEEARRQEALSRLEELRKVVAARNQDLSQDEAGDLADRLVRDVIDEMVKEGKIEFQDE